MTDLDEPSLSQALRRHGMTLENHNDILIVRDPKTREVMFIGSLSKVNVFLTTLSKTNTPTPPNPKPQSSSSIFDEVWAQ